jgi:hypothetical protein
MTTLSILTCIIGEPESLRSTAASIAPFLSKNVEWIIKFSDKSDKAFINSFTGEFIKMYQEPDASLYDAMNQCLKFCESDYYMVLGAGDMLLPEAMTTIVENLKSESLGAASYHAPILFASTGAVVQPDPSSLKHFMSCSHPSSLLKVKNSLAINGFDLRYQIAADYDHMSRYSVAFGAGLALNIPPLVSFMGGGISDMRALEGWMEVNLIRIRVWGTSDIRIYGDILSESATTISNSIRQNFP